MSDFFNNQWTVGIGGSIISGVIVYLITEQIFKRKINKEISENIRLANAEIIYAVRPLVAANVAPSNIMILSLIKSTAKKHDVLANSLLDWPEIVDQLVKEVLENSFLTPESKLQYCQFLHGLLNQYQELEQPSEGEMEDISRLISSRNIGASEIAAFISILFSGVAASITFIFKNKFTDEKLSPENIDLNKIIIIIIPFIALIAVILSRIYISNKRKKILKEQLEEARRVNDDLSNFL